MIDLDKKPAMKIVRDWIEEEEDHVLRVGRIKLVRMMLDAVEETANRTIKPMDFPLYFFEKNVYQYAACGWSDTSWFLIREDADPDVLKWASNCCPRNVEACSISAASGIT